MIYVYLILLLFINAAWLVGILFTIPGNWLMVITTILFAWWQKDNHLFSVYVLVAIAVLALAGEIIEFFAGVGGAKKAGAGWKGALAAIAGALAGAFLGTFLLPAVGTLLGACIGAGGATWIVERHGGKTPEQSMQSGMGAGVGVFVGTMTKFAVGCIIWLMIAVAAFWP